MKKIKGLNQEILDLVEQIKSKRQEAIKAKLAYLQENPDNEEAHLTEEEWGMLKEELLKKNDATSTKMQYTWYDDIDGYDSNLYEAVIRIGNKYISVSSGMNRGYEGYDFSVSDKLEIEQAQYEGLDGHIIYEDMSKEVVINGIHFVQDNSEGWNGVENVISGKKELTKGLEIDRLFEFEKEKRQEFEESLLREDVVEYYLSKTPEELEEEFGTEVARMVGFEQKNAHHCYDLWQHTLHTVASIDTTNLTPEQAKKLKVAAFFHDIGKPDVVGFNPRTNQQNFINHAVHSVDIARPVLENLGYYPEEIQQISFYIAHHDDFLNYKGKVADKDKSHVFFRETTPSTVAEIVVQNQIDWEKLGIDCYLPTHTGNEGIDARNASTNNANNTRKRYICSALVNGVEPRFRDFKNQPIKVDFDMEDIRAKLATGEYSAEYIPTEEDYRLLLEICKADARAQKEEVIAIEPRTKQEYVSDSRDRKIATMQSIGDVIALAYEMGTDKMSEATQNEFSEKMLRYAKRRVEVRETEKKAKQLSEEYEGQLPKNPHSLDDNN